LIEDDPLLRVPVAKALAEAGYQVVSAANGVEGIALLQDRRFEVAVIDVVLPGHVDGVFLAEEARRHNPDLQVIFVSGKPLPAERHLAKLGSFLQKPFRFGELLAAVGQLVGPLRKKPG